MDKHFFIRDAQEEERSIIRNVTLSASAEYQALMSPLSWTRYQQNIIATLDGEENCERIVTKRAGSIIGSVLLFPPAVEAYGPAATSTSYPEVRFLAVLPECRGQGIGNALMGECVQRARTSGAKVIGLHTMEVMKIAVQMYERMGFVRTPETDFRPSEDVLVLGYQHLL